MTTKVTDPKQMHAVYEAAFNAGNLEGLVALYEPGATFAPQPDQRATGHAAIRQALQGFLSLKGRMTMKHAYSMQSGNIALIQCDWKYVATGPDGKPLEMASRSAEVLRQQADGSWLYILDQPFAKDA